MPTVDCGHIAGCTCEAAPLERVPCGQNVMAACAAAAKVWEQTGRNPINGAWTHALADLFTQLQEDGYVLARLSPPCARQGGEVNRAARAEAGAPEGGLAP